MNGKDLATQTMLILSMSIVLAGCTYCYKEEAERAGLPVKNGGQGYGAVISYVNKYIIPGVTRDYVHIILSKFSEVSITRAGARRENISIEPDRCYPIKFSVFYDNYGVVINKQWENVN